jgi:hypothetical protein
MESLAHQLESASLTVLLIGAGLLLLFIIIALRLKKPSEHIKRLLFTGIVASTVLPTIFLIFSTVYINMVSASKGPVHWHADFEIYVCGKRVELKDPQGFSNKIGTATLHEHNDNRIHLEGVALKMSDASLGRFFSVIGGYLTENALSVPVNGGVLSVASGDRCPGQEEGVLQVFVYKTDGDTYKQQELTNPASYIISPFSAVPPGDCVIIEFGERKARTDRICRSFQVAEQLGKIERQE